LRSAHATRGGSGRAVTVETKQNGDDYWHNWWQDFAHPLILSRVPIEPQFKDHVQLVSKGSFFRLYKIAPCPNREAGT
jgi:hypothetical protein